MGRFFPIRVCLFVVALSSLPLLAAGLAAAPAIPTDARGLPLWVPRVWNDFPVRLELADQSELAALLARVPIASFDREQVAFGPGSGKARRLVWQPRVTEDEAAALAAAGYRFTRLPDLDREARTAMEADWAAQAAEGAIGGAALKSGEKAAYHTPEQIGQLLQQTAADHPAIAQYYSLGNSVEGRALHAIVISDNPGTAEAEPEVRLASTIHGNEPVQLENLLRLVEELTANYGTDPVATDLVDHTEIHIVPCLNPDGLAAGTRANADGFDLNRNFPVPNGALGGDGTYAEETETVLVKDHAAAHHFAISLVGHCGAVVVNYLYDYSLAPTPDDAGIRELALEYSRLNAPMYASTSFPQGITNGAAWYVAQGTLQDWSYEQTGCVDFTMEICSYYIPATSQLEQYWLDNRQSLLAFVKAARYGVHGVVTASDTGLPLAATVTVTGNGKPVTTDPAAGDYYKLLPTGTYELTFSAPGRITRTFSGVGTTWGTETVLDVQLAPLAYADVAGHVLNAADEPLASTVTVLTYPLGETVATVATTPAGGGAYTVHLGYGDYTFVATGTGYATTKRRVTVASATRTEEFSLAGAQEVDLFADSFESGLGDWTGAWGVTTTLPYSPTRSLADSPTGSYGSSVNSSQTLASGLDLTHALEGTLSFWARWNLQPELDGVFCEVSTDGGTVWTPLATAYTLPASGRGGQLPAGAPVFENSQSSWVLNSVDLAPYVGQANVRFRLRLRSDSSGAYDGFYCDDFVVHVKLPWTTPAATPAAVVPFRAAPNPFNPATVLRFALAREGAVRLAVFDVRGRLVRRLVNDVLPAGPQAVRWDGRDERGGVVAGGAYFARLAADGTLRTVKLALVK